MQKAKVIFDSRGFSGNIFHILGMVRNQLHKERRIADYNECQERVRNSHSYEEALSIIREYVNLVDSRGEK